MDLSSSSPSNPLGEFAPSEPERPRVPDPPRGLLSWFLRLPLLVKLLGANAFIVLAAAFTVYWAHWPEADIWRVVLLGGLLLVCALGVNVILLVLALVPLHGLDATARRVWAGDLAARVRSTRLADRETARVGSTMNLLLDDLMAERARLRALAGEVIRAGDRERAAIARELHDSTAQMLAALIYQLSAAQRDADPALATRLGELRSLASEILEDVRLLAHTAHPRVLDDLGLLAALRALGHSMTGPTTAQMAVTLVEGDDVAVRALAPQTAAVLYRVTQESVRNALRHAGATQVSVQVRVTPTTATIDVIDDGDGFELGAAESRRAGLGLFTMRERVALVNGAFYIDSAVGRGTRVHVSVPRDLLASGSPAPELIERIHVES